MRAFVLAGPRDGSVVEVEPPVAAAGEVVIDVARVGLCGTDVEFFGGEMAYLEQGHARYPLRIGHEWCGTVASVGAGVVDSWLGKRVTGDTMLGCGHCARCRSGRQHLCDQRNEVGIRGGVPGALAERLAVPVSSLRVLPDAVDDVCGALVEPGGNAVRAVAAAALQPGDRLLVLGPGTIGLLVADIARAHGVEVHVLGVAGPSTEFARTRGLDGVWTLDTLPALPFDAVVDASNATELPGRAVRLVEPGKRVVFIGIAPTPSLIDSRELALKDVTAVGILSGSAGLTTAIEHYADGSVDPRPLVAATLGLDDVAAVLSGWRPSSAGPGPKIHIDPRA